MAKNNWLIPALIVLGLFSVALSVYIASKTTSSNITSRPLARVELNLGSADILRGGMSKKEPLTSKAFIYHLDSIETKADGDATLEFDSGYRIRIPENSLVTLTDEKDKTLLILKRGEVFVENDGQEGSVMISVDGQHWSATDYELKYKRQHPRTTLPDFNSSTATSTPTESGSLSSEYLQETLKSHRGAFFKCYTQLLQKTPGVVGQASLSFTIERNGKISQADVTSSSIQDAGFKKCLIDSLRRVEFRAFSGEPISTIFPLRFE